jgi:hypothetical protein
MKALKEYNSRRGKLYKILKAGTFVGLITSVVGALNHEHIAALWGDKVAAAVLMIGGIVSAMTPSVTSLVLLTCYPEDSSDAEV